MSNLLIAAALAVGLYGDSFGVGMKPYLPVTTGYSHQDYSSLYNWEEKFVTTDVLILSLGANDYDVPHLKLEDRLYELLHTAKRYAKTVILVGPPCTPKHEYLNANYERITQLQMEVATKMGVKYISLKYNLQQDNACNLGRAADGLHFTAEGYENIANMVGQSLR